MSNTDMFQNVLNGAGLEALDQLEIELPWKKHVVTRVGLRVSLKFQNGHTVEKRQAGLRVMNSYFDQFKEHLTHWLPTSGGTPRKIKSGIRPPIEQPEALADVGEYYGSVISGYALGQEIDEPAPFQAHVSCVWDKESHENSDFEAQIPLSWCVNHGFDRVRELALEWSNELCAVHGTAGISLLFDDGSGRERLKFSYFLLKKFPGLDYENQATFSVEVFSRRSENGGPFKIRTISWLTILGEVIIAELGGRDKMRAALGPDCPLFDYDGGTIIQAMPVPELGSTEDGYIPEGYKKVAKLTKPVLFEGYSRSLFQNLPSPLDDREETLKWIRRFD
jgi:Protein of unknown function (DUF3396)